MGLELIIERSTHLLSYTNIFYRSVSCSMVLFIAMCFVQSVLVFFYCFQMILSQGFDFQDLILVFNFYMFLFLFIFFGNCIWPGLCFKTCCKVIKTISEEYGGSDFFLWIWKRKFSYDFKKKSSLRYSYESVILFRFRFNCYRKIILQNDAFLLISSHNLFST